MSSATVRPLIPRMDHGSGMLSAAIGLAIIIAILGFAVNVTIGLWTRSTVDSVAYDAARRIASSGGTHAHTDVGVLEAVAIANAKAMLGEYGSKVHMHFDHDGDPDQVVLIVRAPGFSLLPRLIGSGPIVGGIDSEIVIRRENQ